MSKVSRRDFLKGAAAGAMGVAALGIMSGACAEESAEAVVYTPNETIDTDICIIGGGASGMAAAVEAAEAGAKVVIMDKFAFGGNLACSEGAFAVGSRYQKELGYNYEKEDVFNEIVEYHHFRNNIPYVREFVNRSADLIDWLEAHNVGIAGVGTTCMAIPNSSAKEEYLDKYFWHMWVGQGAAAPVMRENVEKAGCTMLVATSGKQLIMEDGKCVGAYAVSDEGVVYQINAKATIIATGGFNDNPEMISRYTAAEHADQMVYPGMPGHDGDGVNMAWEAGAAKGVTGIFSLGTFQHPSIYPELWCQHMNVLSFQPYLWLNKNGFRYISEANQVPLQAHGAALMNQPDQQTFCVFDQKMMDTMTNEGLICGLRNWPHETTPIAELPEEFEYAKEYGLTVSGATMEEFAAAAAEQFGMDAEQLVATIKEYNEACAAGVDAVFGKDAKWLQPIEVGPFYMVRNTNGHLGTLGGIKVNAKSEVLSAENDKPIPGLFACGNDASTIFGELYDFSVSGEATASALVSGRIAGEFAAKSVL